MAGKPPPLDDEIRGLYHGAPGEFIAARQALAKRLRRDGDPRQGEVRELRKPGLSAWAVNRLFAREPRAMAALVGAGERARAAQRKVEGGGDAAALSALVATIRGEIERLTGRGVELLAETERAPGEAIVERLRTDLQALALDPATAAVAARGWLDEDLAPPGFELLAALQVAAAAARPPPRAKPARPADAPAPARKPGGGTVDRLDEAPAKAAARGEREDRERRARVERARAELTRSEAAAAAERRAAERAGQEAERAAGEAAEAARRAEAAGAAARAARRTADEASARAAAAEATAARAREALARAERS